MMNKAMRMRQAAVLALILILAWMLPLFGVAGTTLTVSAISTDYPVQLMNLASKNASTVLTENGTSDGSAVTMKALGNDLSPSWRFDRVGSDSNGTFFKLVNAQSGRLLTPKNYNVSAGAEVIMYGSESAQSQHWYVVPVSKDRLGNDLYYKIVNYSDTSLALTQGSGGMTLTSYTGADNQLFLLNADGLQGFAGYCSDDNTGSIKAADIGGLFGETVEVTTFADLKKYATSDTPYTIVVTNNISVMELNMNGSRYMCTAGRIYVHSNKTIIGSYSANTLFNVQFCTSTNSGTGNNIIIKNFDMQHDAESNNNDSIVCYFGSGQNIWVDHVTFTGHDNYGYAPQTGQVDEDKFLACCYDADYCTVSDCYFGAHKYGLILGYPSDDANSYNNYNNFPRMSLIANKFDDTNTRGPGLMRYGYFHSLNNYVDTFSMAYTVYTACKIYAENCYYANGGNVICDWGSPYSPGAYSESGSIFVDCGRTVQGADSNSTAGACSWRPTSNYSYVKLDAESAKNYCNSYSGRQTSGSNWMYLRYATKGVPSAGYTEVPNGKPGAAMDPAHQYTIKNYGSGLYLEVAGAAAANGTNVQQGTTGARVWTLDDAGSGYYRIYSEVGDGRTYLLDLDYGQVENGTNIGIWGDTASDAQLFKFVDNGDGTYTICTKPTNDESCLGVNGGSTEEGANVLQWACDGSDNQKWIVEVYIPPINGNLIQNMVVNDLATYQNWTIDTSLAAGDAVFCDRDVVYATIPEALLGAEAVLTACDAKGYAAADTLVTFTAGADMTVYVGLDSRVDPDPAWLSGWTATGMVLVNDKDVSFEVFSMEVEEGTVVKLGGNGQTQSCVNYVILAAEIEEVTEPETEPPTEPEAQGDINEDGSTTIIDLILLQKWMLHVPGTALPNAAAGDLDENGILNVYDLALLKKVLIQ